MIIAGIVTFNPDMKRLAENISSISYQVDAVIIFDNGSKNINNIKEVADRSYAEVICSEHNIGLGAALNKIFALAIQKGANWVITLDQDSICELDYVEKASVYMNNNRIGIIVPMIADHNLCDVKSLERNTVVNLSRCITSASIVRTSVFECVGGYDEFLFVDYVDFDFSVKVTLCGYEIIRIENSVLNHELGYSVMKRILFWKFRYTEHTARREYYIARNIIIFIRRYWKQINVIRDVLSLCKHFVLIIIYDSNKKQKMKALFSGIRDGVKYNGGEYE